MATAEPTTYAATVDTPPGSPLPVVAIRRAPAGLASDFRAVRIVTHRELLRWVKDRRRLVAGLFQPLLWLFVLGTGLSNVVCRLRPPACSTTP
ncbi:MAG: hypothetical protein M3144_01710 [Actinomycetota bacterium]|nr:hypothetical protein [Actinomycetota bacterium]